MTQGGLVILGCGGHARVLVDACASLGRRVTGCLAPEAPDAPWPADIPWLGDDSRLDDMDPDRTLLLNGVGSAGSTAVRLGAFERAIAKGFRFEGVRHPQAWISASAETHATALLMAGCIVQSHATIGENALINSAALVEHDCEIGAHAHIASRAALGGGVWVGAGAHIGLNAALRQGVRVGANAVVGAGAVVIADVPDGAIVVGIPARPIEEQERRAVKDRIRQLIIPETATVRDALLAIDSGSLQIALVTDAEDRLLFTVTDGDIRRGLLAGIGPDSPVMALGGKPPRTIGPEASDAQARQIMRQHSFHHLPVVDASGRLLDLIYVDDLSGLRVQDTQVVLMAGGLGNRLRPLTEHTPKPMLRLGDRPILETIVRALSDQGFSNLVISLNYRGEQIRDHFGDGSRFGVDITYVVENERMGTAGALTLLPDRPTQPFIVMNADLLTTIRYEALVNFHRDQAARATICAWEYSHQIPYGVLKTDGTRLVGIEEKPNRAERVSAGIYVLSPEVLDLLDGPAYTDMPDLLERMVATGDPVSVFALRETWIDIGRIEDLERARAEFDKGRGPSGAP